KLGALRRWGGIWVGQRSQSRLRLMSPLKLGFWTKFFVQNSPGPLLFNNPPAWLAVFYPPPSCANPPTMKPTPVLAVRDFAFTVLLMFAASSARAPTPASTRPR